MNSKILIGVLVVGVVLMGKWWIWNNQFSQDIRIQEVRISMKRGPCFGTCPVYSLVIYGNGTVVYEGENFVKVTGKQISKISQGKVRKLIDEFYEINYFSLKDSYEEHMITDLATVITSITINGKTKTVRHYHGDMNTPKELTQLENKIDEIVNSSQWIK